MLLKIGPEAIISEFLLINHNLVGRSWEFLLILASREVLSQQKEVRKVDTDNRLELVSKSTVKGIISTGKSFLNFLRKQKIWKSFSEELALYIWNLLCIREPIITVLVLNNLLVLPKVKCTELISHSERWLQIFVEDLTSQW